MLEMIGSQILSSDSMEEAYYINKQGTASIHSGVV